MYTPVRIVLLFAVLAIALTIYVSALYTIQIYQPSISGDEIINKRVITRTSILTAARGNIYDRNGVLLASGRPSYNIKLDWWSLRGSPVANDVVSELIYAAMDEGIAYTDTFPVTNGAPFEYLSGMSTVQQKRLAAYFEFHNIDPDIPVSDLLAWMHDHYKIDYTVGILDARLIIGVRYELEIRAIMGSITPYIFAADVSSDFVSYIEERNLTGVYTESTYIRVYHTNHAPHLLGYIGAMSAEEYEFYKEQDYPMDAIVGKVGSEYAFEEYLRGINGERVIKVGEDGTILSDEITKMPQPGQHIQLTLDLEIQIAAENALRTQIEKINALRREKNNEGTEEEELEMIPGGAVVVTNVHTGEILAAASFPTYDLTTLSENWSLLNTDPGNPMLNRATQGRYPPGSTFKMVTALAALRHIGVITRYFPITDEGVFDKYKDVGFTASCWLWGESRGLHGDLDIVQALERSCNYYFLQVSDWFPGGAAPGAEILAETALEFGLGRTTGLEIPENAGRLATPQARREAYERGLVASGSWFSADTLLAGFGQGDNRFTPVQLANYAATIGNGGTLYSLSFLLNVRSSDFTEILYTHKPEMLNEIKDTENIEILQEGMLAVSKGAYGTARSVFREYPIPVAAKTGTVQVEGTKMNDGVFVCYAPADDPQIAISIVVEKGGSGSQVMDIARMIFDQYFMTESTFQVIPYGKLIP